MTSKVICKEILPQLEPESITDLPKEALDGNPQFAQQDEETTIGIDILMQARQGENVDYEGDTENELPASSTEHWSTQGCTKPNEYFNSCGPRCVQTCMFQPRANGRTSRAACESIFSGNCNAGCFCVDGYVRFNNQCIKPVDCPTRVCLGNEEFKFHGTPCQITCDSYPYAEEIEKRCPKDIPVSGCFCKNGYVRSATGSCILPNRCPRPLVS
ncbi:hypothetical protein PVAND_011741 [Polypedilum vanderplanki]|uniref:TIL domain-containing protein n=1 Tax=Polypedilum vanderplanki TaxID=319348 RepID=A0A9J6CK84_POLVA|nr:hypothetical protein PVAND_011741 [Polypedilum vanderplanki]